MTKNDVKYDDLVEMAKESKQLYHFTDFESLQIILKNNSFRLSRLDILNDPAEAKRVDDFWQNKIYSFSFCSGNVDFEYFWSNYAKAENIGLYIVIKNFDKEDIDSIFCDSECNCKMGVFNTRTDLSHKDYDGFDDWLIYNVSKASVFYVDELKDYTVYDSIIFENDCEISLLPGLIKKKQGLDNYGISQNWEIENEQRVRVAIRPKGKENILNRRTNKFEVVKPSFKYFYFKIPSKIVKIIINPKVDEKNRQKVCQFINSLDLDIEVE